MNKVWLTLATGALLAGAARADNWPAWRGPLGTGHSTEKNPPVRWSASENVRWKVPLPGRGNSTPITWGDRIFLTQALDEPGTRRAVLCLSRRDGRKLWEHAIGFNGKESTHADNPYCSGSPATDGARVVAFHGSAGVVCLDLNGNELWRRDLGTFEHIWGNASSPVIYQNLVILNCGPGERQFLLALDKKTGKEVWKVDEPGGNAGANSNDWSGSWSTPVITRLDGKDILLMSWPGVLRAMDPRSGSELWSCKGLSKLVYTSPLPSPEAVVAMCGYGGAWMGVRPGGSGEVTESHRLWRVERAQQRIGSGVIIGEHVYMVNEPGTAECIELKTGKVIWSERLGGSTWGSVLHADGKLFATSRRGETFVFAAKPQFELLGRNALDETTLSSPILSNGEILIRTYQHLWCIAPGR